MRNTSASRGKARVAGVSARHCRMLVLVTAVIATEVRPAFGQQDVVAGVVLESRGLRPLAGAQVIVEGTTRGMITDVNGRFRITGLTGQTGQLEVVMIGYRAYRQTVRIGDVNVRVVMQETAIELEEVVVTGTVGATTRRELGNSVSTVKAADVAASAPIRNMQELINARAPGLIVMPGTGMVGSGSKIRIRGQSTFSLSGEPLIFVDGVRVNNEVGTGYSLQGFGSGVVSRLNDFNPDDIENIEILKGPAAATLYGSEAGRGVINIITKKGAPGASARFSLTTRQGANWVDDPEGRWPTNYWRNPTTGQIEGVNLIVSENERGTPVFRTGQIRGYTAQVSGGSQTTRYFVSGDFDDQEGAERNNFREQFSGRANFDIIPNQKFDVSVSTGYVKSTTGLSCEAGCGGVMWGTMFGSPSKLGRNCSASSPYGCGFGRGMQSWSPETYYARSDNQDINRFTGSAQIRWRPLSWLNNRFTVGTDLTDEQTEAYVPYLTNDTLRFFWGASSNGFKAQQRRVQNFNTFDYAGSAEFNVNKFALTSTLGIQYYQRHIEYLAAEGADFPAPGFETVASTARPTLTSDDYLDNNSLGVFAQQQVGLNDRLYLTAALRVDNNSAFGADLDWVTYPKMSLSWVLHEEPVVRERLPDLINSFRLRVAYGESGQQPAAFSALRTYIPAVGPGGTSAITPNSFGNSELGPERGRELEFGFDTGLLNERVGVEFTYYNTHTYDAILSRQISPSSGFAGSQLINAGQINNYGVEAILRGQVIGGEKHGLDLTITAATNGSKVKKLIGTDTTIVVGDIQHKIGYPAWAWFRERVVSAEYDAATDRVFNVMCDDGNGGTMPCFRDNVFGAPVVAPRLFLGRTTPSLEISVQPTIKLFTRLRVHGMIDIKRGYKKFDNNLRARCQVFLLCLENMHPEEYDPALIAQIRSNNTLKTWVIRDAGFAKLREVSATYNVPEIYAGRIGARSMMINVAARNLRTWTNYTGLDPEAMFLSGSPNFLEQDNLPQLTSIVATISVSF